MSTARWRRGWPLLERLLAELVWLHPANAATFGRSAAEDAVDDATEEVARVRRAA